MNKKLIKTFSLYLALFLVLLGINQQVLGQSSNTSSTLNVTTSGNTTNTTNSTTSIANSTSIDSVSGNSSSADNAISDPLNGSNAIVIPEDGFNPKEVPGLISELVALNATERCISRIANLLSYMSDAEQIAFSAAFKAQRANSTSVANTGRCFAPGYLKKIFIKIVKGEISKEAEKLTSNSRSIRNSFTCVKKAFDKIKSSLKYDEPITKFVNAQADSNKCLSSFIYSLRTVLSARRRYFLLTSNDLNNTGIVANGTIKAFPWLEPEVVNVTSAFLTFAQCYQSFPESIVSAFSDIRAILAQDSACTLTPAATSTNTTSATNATTPVNNTTNITGTNTTNTTTTTNSTAAGTNSTKTGRLLQGNSNNNKNAVSSSNKEKKASIGAVAFTTTDIDFLSQVVSNYRNKTDNPQFASFAASLSDILNSTLNTKCNFASQIIEMVNDKQVKYILNSELTKVNRNTPCINADYIITLNVNEKSNSGNLACVNTEAKNCVAGTVAFTNYSSRILLAFGCSAGVRYSSAYSASSSLGNYFDFVSVKFSSCKAGTSSNCASEIKKLAKAKTFKFLQSVATTQSSCLASMQQNCQDVLNTACSESNLYQYIGSNAPSSSNSPLPDACKSVALLTDATATDYIPCFKWIKDNLFIYTLFLNIKNILNIQATIVASQQTTATSSGTTLRYLQSTSTSSDDFQMVKNDASTQDTESQLPQTSYLVATTSVQIDGSTPEASADISTQTNIVVQGNTVPLTGAAIATPTTSLNQSGSTISHSFVKILVVLLSVILLF